MHVKDMLAIALEEGTIHPRMIADVAWTVIRQATDPAFFIKDRLWLALIAPSPHAHWPKLFDCDGRLGTSNLQTSLVHRYDRAFHHRAYINGRCPDIFLGCVGKCSGLSR